MIWTFSLAADSFVAMLALSAVVTFCDRALVLSGLFGICDALAAAAGSGGNAWCLAAMLAVMLAACAYALADLRSRAMLVLPVLMSFDNFTAGAASPAQQGLTSFVMALAGWCLGRLVFVVTAPPGGRQVLPFVVFRTEDRRS